MYSEFQPDVQSQPRQQGVHRQNHKQHRLLTKRVPIIVVADDDRALRDLLSEQLHKDGCDVVQAWDGASLLDYVRYCEKRRQPPDMIITDIHMPKLSGLQVLQQVELLGWQIPIIVMTGMSSAQEIETGHLLGAIAVFYKPFDLNTLRATVHCCLRQPTMMKRAHHKRSYAM